MEEGAQPEPVLKPTRKRKRIVISCTECHRRKQKCDRSFPCSNCIARNKQSLCRYENESARKQQLLEEANTLSEEGILNRNAPNGTAEVAAAEVAAAQVAALGYAKSNGQSDTTLGIFKRIEDYRTEPSSWASSQTPHTDYSGLRERYKSLVRQLPPKAQIEKLLVTYFHDYNIQYYPLDEGIFRDLWKKWCNLPFSTLNKGPQELHPDLQFFPALLFQMVALALQFQPPDYDPSLDCLKYAAVMSLDDLATDYSESGVSILSLLGKRNITLVTVQAGFLRCSYLKNCGMVTESWHFLSQTIRDAQEMDLHQATVNHQPRKPEEVVEGLWIEQLRRRVWMLLSIWDIRMALVLGRPTTIDIRDPKPPFPIDAPVPKNRFEIAPAPRGPSDPPTPLTLVLWNAEMAAPLLDISQLEREGPHPSDFSKVERMYILINHVARQCPPYFRAHNPDETFDNHPDCYWLQQSRPHVESWAGFNLMALHRPYIFTRASSRTAALRAGIDILRSQRTLFDLIEIKDYKMHSLVLNTFDALILAAAIYILHPSENRSDLHETMQHFEWGMERFETMNGRNSMAKAALDVLRAIHTRLKKALSCLNKQCPQSLPSPSETPPSVKPNISLAIPTLPPPEIDIKYSAMPSTTPITTSNTVPQYVLPTISNLTESTSNLGPSQSPAPDWDTFSAPTPNNEAVTPNLDPSLLAPLQPLHDLLYNDLGTFVDSLPPDAPTGAGMYDVNAALADGGGTPATWQFEGDFGSDSFWGFMNTYNP